MLLELLNEQGFKIRSIGNFGRGKERIFINFLGIGHHQWYYKSAPKEEPIAIKNKLHFYSIIQK